MKKFSILTILVLIFGFLSSISCGYLISSAVVSTFGYTSTITTQQQSIYAISIAQSDTAESLTESIESLQAQNGAGYIYQTEDRHHLIASIYENFNDAELVKNNLSASNIDCKILSLKLPSKTIEGNFSSDEKSVLENALNYDMTVFKKLYDIAISLDTGIYDTTKAKLLCNEIYSGCISVKANIETLFKDLQSQTNAIKNDLEFSASCLLELANEKFQSQTQSFSSLIKLTYCKILLN